MRLQFRTMNRYTTHLVCAPEDLPNSAQVIEWLVAPGNDVISDEPLVCLAVAGEVRMVVTPLDGVLVEQCVAIGERLDACGLVAMIEAEEKPFGASWSIDPEDADASLSLAACRLEAPPPAAVPAVVPEGDALAWCAALGIAPDEVDCDQHGLTVAAVQRHVRAELRRLAAIRELLSK
ncbi:hypothetical protein [Chitinimonas lacunae]|uniref:Uncharacterized protein n=1 Tax=Chitinimonas lacunae TaxID=1963018 RepID=A0ABV8MSB8_9NEIS